MMGFAKILCLVAVISSITYTRILASETCRAAMDWCPSGTIAGCDALEALACQDGRSCEAPLSICKGGSIAVFFEALVRVALGFHLLHVAW